MALFFFESEPKYGEGQSKITPLAQFIEAMAGSNIADLHEYLLTAFVTFNTFVLCPSMFVKPINSKLVAANFRTVEA